MLPALGRDPVVDETASATADLDGEQEHLEAAYHVIDVAIATLRGRLRPGAEGEGVDETAATSLSHEWARQLRGYMLRLAAPFFARIDTTDGDTRHIGPHAVYSADGNLLVINWRVPAAEAFYLATPNDEHGLTRRRRFAIDDRERRVCAFEEERFDTEASPRDVGLKAAIEDVLHERSAEMRAIVATIRPDQYEIIQQAPEWPLFVYGGPGTGKSAVGLHRAAWLLYRDERLARRGVLVVGPNRTFMDYIGVILPYLGEQAVEQRAITEVPSLRARREDAPELVRLKGDVRMAELLRRALWARVRRTAEGGEVRIRHTSLAVPTELVHTVLEVAIGISRPYGLARERFIRELRAVLVKRMDASPRFRAFDAESELSGNRDLQALFDRVWPSITGERVVYELLTNRRQLCRAADGVLSPDEVKALCAARPRRKTGWATTADAVLVDEADALIRGPSRVFGHVVVDEVQDLSAMQLRMLARRSDGRSMTLLGDLAQATSVGSLGLEGVEGLEGVLGVDRLRTSMLEISYRVPRQFLELAARLLPDIAPGLQPPRAVRDADEPVRVERTAGDRLAVGAGELVMPLVQQVGSIGVVAPPDLAAAVLADLHGRAVHAGDVRSEGLSARVTVGPPVAMKGLEFDRVVVVEPAAIAEAENGLEALYVSLTRATRFLGIVHARALPAALATPAAEAPLGASAP